VLLSMIIRTTKFQEDFKSNLSMWDGTGPCSRPTGWVRDIKNSLVPSRSRDQPSWVKITHVLGLKVGFWRDSHLLRSVVS
jgi:hypothetical protein